MRKAAESVAARTGLVAILPSERAPSPRCFGMAQNCRNVNSSQDLSLDRRRHPELIAGERSVVIITNSRSRKQQRLAESRS